MVAEDAGALLHIFADPEVMQSFDGLILSPEMMARWVQRNLDRQQRHGYGLFSVILKSEDVLIGDCGLEHMEVDGSPEVEIGYDFRSDYWGRGFATEAATAVRDFAFHELHLPRVISLIRSSNAASARVAEKIGMVKEKEIRIGERAYCIYGRWQALGLRDGALQLVPYREEWPRLYEQEAEGIRTAIGAHILDIQHVGSTAIPGMIAKPILDIAIAVESFEAAAVCIAPLEALGYRYRGENGIPRRHYFVRGYPMGSPAGGPRTHHVHMVEIASTGWKDLLSFRDALRADPALAREYAELKLRLAAKHANDRSAYQDGKADFIRKVQEDSHA